ncbi:hypothetical protein R1flu_022369 [Riccia fluitans]|uniref:Uncharacterized protein n=1 Tax=Riccia fluitans TaxID=41844 RepID=A0ABD1ZRZ8_9MARC
MEHPFRISLFDMASSARQSEGKLQDVIGRVCRQKRKATFEISGSSPFCMTFKSLSSVSQRKQKHNSSELVCKIRK